MTTVMSSPVRVPVGSLIAIGPPGSGKSTVLKDKLAAAGLPLSRFVNRDDIRRKFGNECSQLMCRAIPARCAHHDDAVASRVEAYASTFLAAGRTWMYDATHPDVAVLAEHVDRAHRAGVAAVALRRTGLDGAENIAVDQCLTWNASRTLRVPDSVVRTGHQAYLTMSTERLYELGFDIVLDWDEHTTFELLPETEDARQVPTGQVVVVGDIHGCARTFFERMLPAVGTDKELSNPDVLVVSVGDIHDKGGDPYGSVEMLRWWLRALRTGRALMVDSNHNRSLVRHLTGHHMWISPGLADTLAAIDAQPDAEDLKAQIVAAFSRLPSHLRFDDLIVVHAAITEDHLGATSARSRGFMLYTNSERTPWQWTGPQTVVRGHEPVQSPTRHRAVPTAGEVINIDTGAYTGGGMTAYVHATNSTITVETFADEVTTHNHDHEYAEHEQDIDIETNIEMEMDAAFALV